jgi:hypothetical protein
MNKATQDFIDQCNRPVATDEHGRRLTEAMRSRVAPWDRERLGMAEAS